jgi:hypothetical protein
MKGKYSSELYHTIGSSKNRYGAVTNDGELLFIETIVPEKNWRLTYQIPLVNFFQQAETLSDSLLKKLLTTSNPVLLT